MSDEKRDDKREEFKAFVGGLSWSMKDSDLRSAFEKYGVVDATIIVDKHTNKPRGFGFVFFKDKQGMDDAIRDMHDKDLEGRKISVRVAVPQDQVKPGTPAYALGGGGRRDPRYGGRDYGGRDYGRDYRGGGYDRYGGGYDRAPYDRGYGGGYDPRGYAPYDSRGYDHRGYGYGAYDRGADPYARDPYARDPYAGYDYAHHYDRAGYGAYDSRYPADRPDDRGAGGPDRRGYAAPRSGPYDRPADRRPAEASRPR